MMTNPRSANGNLRRKNRARFRAMGLPCHICGKPIHYDEPSDSRHPLSFVIDEVIPVSRWREYGFNSAREAAETFDNLAPAHYMCNAQKSSRTPEEMKAKAHRKNVPGYVISGNW